MDKYQETFETWNNVASLYQDKFMHLDLYNSTYDFICNSITKSHAKVLEIGCGPGNITKYLLTQRPDFDMLGIDIAPNMIALAKSNNLSARFAVMDSRDIGALNTTFDGIVCGFCLPYLSQTDCLQLIHDSYNLLAENGFIYLSFVEGDTANSGYLASSTGGRTYFYYHDLENIKSLLVDKGFEAFKVFNVVYHKTVLLQEMHTIVTAKKKSTT